MKFDPVGMIDRMGTVGGSTSWLTTGTMSTILHERR